MYDYACLYYDNIMTLYDFEWLCMTLMTVFDFVLLSMTKYDYIWLYHVSA